MAQRDNYPHPGEDDDLGTEVLPGDAKWVKLIRDAYRSSTDYLDSGILGQWEDSLARFGSRHPKGSKYHTRAYKARSKTFRPKTRSFARRAEAMAAKALFANSDLIDVRGQNKGSAIQAASARLNKELLQYRLEHSIPWFVTSMGARQDCFNYGVCISLSTWRYEEEETTEIQPLMDPVTGEPVLDEEGNELGEEVSTITVKHDKPVIELLPPENLRIDPNASWVNPIEDSPVITVLLPMYVGEILQKMSKPNPVTEQPEWREYSVQQILSSRQEVEENQSIRRAREGNNRQDTMDTQLYNEYTNIFVHLNIVRDEGVDYAFYSLGSRMLLTDPVPVRQVLPLGRESLTVGFAVLESHRVYPTGANELVAPLQAEVNDIANQRMDNVKLALNKRFILKRNANIDQSALMRSVPGGGVMADDPANDVRVLEYNDVTGSSYQEQDRLANEMDDLGGVFSGSSVQSNRSLNETVGGMSMLQGDAASVAEYELRTWIETWVEPVVRKLQKLEAMFETDEVIMSVAAENAEVFQRYGEDVAVDQLIDHELVVSVNVGMGATDPMQKIQKFSNILQVAGGLPEVAQRLKGAEVGKEIFSMGGYSETERFFMSEEEYAQAAQAAEGQSQQAPDTSLEVAQIRAQNLLELEQMKSADRRYESDLKAETQMQELAASMNIQLKVLYEKIGVDKEKVQAQRDTVALREGNHSREMGLKRDMGSGI